MELTEKELKNFPYYPSTRIDYFEKYPKLKDVPEFARYKGKHPFEKIFTYIILYYTKGTPLMQISDHNDRKRAAAELSHFALRNSSYQDVVMARDKDVNKVIIAYLRLQKSFAWSKLCGYIDSFYHQLGRLQGGGTDDEKTKELLVNIPKTEEEINKTLDSILNGDPGENVRDIVLEKIETERIGKLRPEEMADAENKEPKTEDTRGAVTG